MADNIETVALPAPEAPKLAPVPALKESEPFLSEKAMYKLKAKTALGGTHHRIQILTDEILVSCLLNEFSTPTRMTPAEFEAAYQKV